MSIKIAYENEKMVQVTNEKHEICKKCEFQVKSKSLVELTKYCDDCKLKVDWYVSKR